MIINIKVIPNAKKNSVSKENNKLKIHVNVPAVEGKANKAVIEVLSKYFNIKKNKVKIIKGEKSREKLVELL